MQIKKSEFCNFQKEKYNYKPKKMNQKKIIIYTLKIIEKKLNKVN